MPSRVVPAEALAPMDVVIDSNRLRSDELRTFLAASPRHRAVLADYASIEAYKINPLTTIQKSMEILGEFPAQVLVLRGTGKIARLDSRKPGLVQNMVWDEYTRTFPLHAASIPFIGANEATMVSGAIKLHVKAKEHIADLAPDHFRAFHEIFSAEYSKDDIRNLRQGVRTPELMFNMLETAVVGAAHLLDDERRFDGYDYHEVLNDFAVRNILAKLLLNQKWILDGRPSLSDERLVNDQVDSIFVAHATFFNGLMSADRGARNLHDRLRELLGAMAKEDKRLIMPTAYGAWTV